MATSVLLACGLSDAQPPPLTFIREEEAVDASFLITSVLGQRCRVPGTGVVLVCLHHTCQHYVAAGVRLGFNLQSARDKGALLAVDTMAALPQLMAASGDALLADLWAKIGAAIQTHRSAQRTKITVILDDLSALLDLGATEAWVLRFARQLAQLAAAGPAAAAAGTVAVVVKLNTSNLYELLASNLEALADAEVQCLRLRSGQFREVDGRLVSLRRPAADAPHVAVAKSMLYKVNERNVKIYAPGEVGIAIGK